MPTRRAWFPLLAAGCLFAATSRVEAEDGPTPQEDLRSKLKAQVEKILKLMRENEAALLEASTAGGVAPKGPEVKVPDLPPSPTPPPPDGGGSGQGNPGGAAGGSPPGGGPAGGAPPSGGSNGGAAGGGPGRGEEIRKRLDELIQGQQQGASKIPDELEQLVKMVPMGKSGGSPGSGDPSGGKSGEQPDSPEAREAKRLKELQEKEQPSGKDGHDPKSGEKPPEGENHGRPPGESEPKPPEDPNDPTRTPWKAELPPEWRSSESGGGLESLPGRLGDIIREYLKNLHRQTTPGTPPR